MPLISELHNKIILLMKLSCGIYLDHEIFRPFYEIICQKDEFFSHIINLLRPNLEIMFQKTNFPKKRENFTTI